MDQKNHRVFVYGTLKNGFFFHDEYLGGSRSVPQGIAKASTDYSLYVDGMPHLVREKSDKQVKGELYLVNDETMKSLDKLWSPVYKRDVIEVFDETGKKFLAWAYLRPRHFKGYQYAHKEEEFI